MKDVPYIVFESEMARMERIIKRLWIVIIILIFLLCGLVYRDSLYEDMVTTETVTQEVDDVSGDAIVNGTGEVNINGKD